MLTTLVRFKKGFYRRFLQYVQLCGEKIRQLTFSADTKDLSKCRDEGYIEKMEVFDLNQHNQECVQINW